MYKPWCRGTLISYAGFGTAADYIRITTLKNTTKTLISPFITWIRMAKRTKIKQLLATTPIGQSVLVQDGYVLSAITNSSHWMMARLLTTYRWWWILNPWTKSSWSASPLGLPSALRDHRCLPGERADHRDEGRAHYDLWWRGSGDLSLAAQAA